MTLVTLYTDELRGFSRSRLMLALWIGLPVLSIVLRLAQPQTEGIPLLTFVSILIGSVGGTLAAVLLATSITSERLARVYDLFLVRPVRRRDLLVSKFLAAFTALLGAAVASIGVAVVIDLISGTFAPGVVTRAAQSLIISLAGMTIAASVGLLLGVLINSVAVSAILAVYLGNQLSAVIVLPTVLVTDFNVWLFAPLVGLGVPVLLLVAAILVFRRKSL